MVRLIGLGMIAAPIILLWTVSYRREAFDAVLGRFRNTVTSLLTVLLPALMIIGLVFIAVGQPATIDSFLLPPQ